MVVSAINHVTLVSYLAQLYKKIDAFYLTYKASLRDLPHIGNKSQFFLQLLLRLLGKLWKSIKQRTDNSSVAANLPYLLLSRGKLSATDPLLKKRHYNTRLDKSPWKTARILNDVTWRITKKLVDVFKLVPSNTPGVSENHVPINGLL